jgi:hypothetical protein
MARPNLFNWLGYAFLMAVQVFYAWAVFSYVPGAVDWYMGQGNGFTVPVEIQGFLNSYSFFTNSLFFWLPVWIAVLGGLAILVWRYRSRRWPFWLVSGLATLHLVYVVTMMVIIIRHVAEVTSL